MSNISIEIDNDFINQLVQEKVESILSNYKREVAAVDIKDLVTITGLSKSTLQNKIVLEPEIKQYQRRIGSRVLYLYPEVIEGYKAYLNRIN
ncbi:hypothetical protein [Staphylococcus epidermidis]|uniref:hypothetical protein n=1 Tax=Staphylococcus epidermidis TaxID=1282 RepID=UPI000C1914D3|nr:hypothetical protein [Staphylococcus epidermidis]NAM13552.1 hypothetical protein [Staphylococcus epidermidis]